MIELREAIEERVTIKEWVAIEEGATRKNARRGRMRGHWRM
jgi:hypothetical protein